MNLAGARGMYSADGRGASRKRWWYLLLLLPFIGVLWVPFYSGAQPELAGVPFFYWYQFLWVIIAAVLTAIVYLATRDEDQV
jgi:hypothetical protein